MDPNLHRRNLRVMAGLVLVVAGMTGLSFAAVPLYDLFCKVTGFGGTTQVAQAAPGQVSERTVKVRFNADVNGGLNWSFRPAVREVEVRLGEPATVEYIAKNLSRQAVTGTATYNVTPEKTGVYFSKVQCFCFTEQRLEPGEEVRMPVMFFVDPELADDVRTQDVTTITLSYTFFRAASDQVAVRTPAATAAGN
ncbi:MAG TPA: cytochrome c oxidase assembly protein [Azospirillaceae bacterium]|nr:cytochrome c oxidase assembly protein [Azospirillaceae bacterium]